MFVRLKKGSKPVLKPIICWHAYAYLLWRDWVQYLA